MEHNRLNGTAAAQAKAEGVREVGVGNAVIYHDSQGHKRNALVTCVWSPKCVNLVIVSDDENEKDSWGRQIKRKSSCLHKSQVPVHGEYRRFSDETPNPWIAPVE